jgi:hypothetical protein
MTQVGLSGERSSRLGSLRGMKHHGRNPKYTKQVCTDKPEGRDSQFSGTLFSGANRRWIRKWRTRAPPWTL